MGDQPNDPLADAELKLFLDALFPLGVDGADVMDEVAPTGWAQSPVAMCFHPSTDRLLEEGRQMSERLAELGIEPAHASAQVIPADQPIKPAEELAEVIGLCLWDVFSDNHDVLRADGRNVDLGSFRSASAFLDDYIGGRASEWGHGDCMRFYMGTFAIAGRADLTPVYVSIFRRLVAVGGSWVYQFPEVHLVDFGSADDGALSRLRADLAAANERARDRAMDWPAPATVRAYRQVTGRDPKG